MQKIAKEDLIKDVLDVYNRFGRVSKNLYIANGKYSTKPINRIFGSWNNMLNELDIELNQKVGENKFAYTNDELLNDLSRIYDEFGVCCARLIKEEGISCLEVYQRRFGSINKAMELVGIPTRKSGESIVEKTILDKISSILDSKYEYQKRFGWLINPKTGKRLVVDGYFEEYNLAIEYNGRQHYEVVSFIRNDSPELLEIRKERDAIKYKLLEENNVRLLIINYNESTSRKELIKRLSNII